MKDFPRKAAFQLIAHTADIGLEVTAGNREALFLSAAQGLRTLLFGDSPAEATMRRELSLSAGDLAELLVVWLNEVLVFCETERAVPAGFNISHLDDRGLIATVTGESFDPSRHLLEHTAKAVTYHQLVVEERKTGWYARAYIDL